MTPWGALRVGRAPQLFRHSAPKQCSRVGAEFFATTRTFCAEPLISLRGRPPVQQAARYSQDNLNASESPKRQSGLGFVHCSGYLAGSTAVSRLNCRDRFRKYFIHKDAPAYPRPGEKLYEMARACDHHRIECISFCFFSYPQRFRQLDAIGRSCSVIAARNMGRTDN